MLSSSTCLSRCFSALLAFLFAAGLAGRSPAQQILVVLNETVSLSP
jgi:hypothetical protein